VVSPTSTDQGESQVTLPSFLTRIQNAAGPLLGGIGESTLADRLSECALLLEIDESDASDPGHRASYLLAANLGARLYPRLSLDGPEELVAQAVELARAINSGCEFGAPRKRSLTLSWKGGAPSMDKVTVAIDGWNISLDGTAAAAAPAEPLAAMAAATLGIGQIFRAVFGDLLPHGRTGPEPFSLSWLTLDEPMEAPAFPKALDLGTFHLAGCGAIGQAVVLALRELPINGKVVAVDHETLDPGNLQRYLLSGSSDVQVEKVALVERALQRHGLKVEAVPTRWGESDLSAPGRGTVLSAFDTKQARIELQAGLPEEIFNAWTQPEDVGVSRHQRFGSDPCLACLGWPQHQRPSRSEQIAESLGENELRVVRYLASGLPVGQPLSPEQLQPTRRLPLPDDAHTWVERSLLEDLIQRYELPRQQFEPLGILPVDALYRDAVCAEMLIKHRGENLGADISVPLAHQSALAGILLATWLVVDRVPELRALRPRQCQARYDVLRGGQQVWSRHRERTSACLCSDPDFLAAYEQRWHPMA
jgi:hypothetical protein